jgi:uncharacterized protein
MDDRTVESTAAVATDRPGRYAKQLVAHLSRRTSGEWNEDAGTGWIDFGPARAEFASGDNVLNLYVRAAKVDLDRYEDVVGRHLVRFGTRDELIVYWLRADGSPGTEQRRVDDDGDAPAVTG